MYSMGGWNTRPGSCSSGFKSRPFSPAGNRRSNGFDVNRMNNSKPVATSPSTPSTRATMASSSERENCATATPQPDSINTHSSSEPSWPPHTAPKRYMVGNCELECSDT